jgi:hypothetical protein
VWGLRDPAVRDRALALALGPDAAAAEQLWTECTRRAPAPLDAAPATLLAVSTWLRGDGAMADVALNRALSGEPGYALARLLAQALAACMRPAELRALIDEAVRSRPVPSPCNRVRHARYRQVSDLIRSTASEGAARVLPRALPSTNAG